MKRSQEPAQNRFPNMLCRIALIVLAMISISCQQVAEPVRIPERDGEMPSMAGARAVTNSSVDPGPVITLTNEYLEPGGRPLPGYFMKIPDGTPLTFCWSAEPLPGGGAIEAYRYGWDVFDLNDPEAWDIPFTPYDGSNVCSASRTFHSWGIHLFAVEVIDDAGASSMVIVIIQSVRGPASFDVMPGPCHNPLSTQRKGRIRTVIPGRIGLAVSEIDVTSLSLWIDGNVVPPVGTRVRDIASPMINRDLCDCPPSETDGIDDLVIYFAAGEIIHALGQVVNGESRELSIHGTLLDGYDFSVNDCVEIVGNPRMGDDPALFSRDAVLVALNKGYNTKDYQKVGAIFDDDFTFYFSAKDVSNGDVPFSQWGREEELAATANLFNADVSAAAPVSAGSLGAKHRLSGSSEETSWGRIKAAFFNNTFDGETTIGLILAFAEGDEHWVSILPPDPDRYPGELWYQKSANYYLFVQKDDMSYYTELFEQAIFTVRFSEAKGIWQLIQWRDEI